LDELKDKNIKDASPENDEILISNENLKINSQENFDLFFEKYVKWTDNLFGNGRTVVGYVAKMEWLPNRGLSEEK